MTPMTRSRPDRERAAQRSAARLAVLVVAVCHLACTCGPPTPPDPNAPPPMAVSGPPNKPLARASWDARPAWVDRDEGYAPRRSDAEEIFKAAANPATNAVPEPQKGLFACRVEVGKETSAGEASPDLEISVELGFGGGWLAMGPRVGVAFFTIPLAEIATGDLVRMHLVDDDTFFDDDLGTLSAEWKGVTPLTAQSDETSYECRFVTAESVEKLFTTSVAAVDAKLEEVEKIEHDLVTLDLGAMESQRHGARAAIGDLAALRGWAHKDVVTRDKRSEAADARLVADGKKVLADRAAQKTSPPFRLGQLAIQSAAWKCRAADAGIPSMCGVVLVGANDSRRPLRFETVLGHANDQLIDGARVYVLSSDTRLSRASLHSVSGGAWTPSKRMSGFEDMTLAAGATIELTMGPLEAKPDFVAVVRSLPRKKKELLLLAVP